MRHTPPRIVYVDTVWRDERPLEELAMIPSHAPFSEHWLKSRGYSWPLRRLLAVIAWIRWRRGLPPAWW